MPVTMKVEPVEVLRLKARLEAVSDSVTDFIANNTEALRVAPFADDDVSQDAAKDFAANSSEAIEVTRQVRGAVESNHRGA